MREIHTIDIKRRKILLDVVTCRFFRIDDLSQDVLDLLKGDHTREEVVEILGTRYGRERVTEVLGELEEAGLLEEEDDVVPPVPSTGIAHLCLHVAHDCNLRCRYCYGGGGDYGGPRGFMNQATARKAVDFLLEESGQWKNCYLLFFGGEPLLNFDLIRYIVPYARKEGEKRGKAVSFGISTNGTLLTDDILDFLDGEDISVLVSLDGLPAVHDRCRIFPSGRGSYDRILPGVRELIDRREGRVTARATVTHHGIHFLQTIVHLLDLGFRSVTIDLACGSGRPWSVTEDDVEIIKEEYNRVTDYFLEKINKREHFGFSNFTSLLGEAHRARRRTVSCGAAIHYVAVSPEGEIYVCHRFVGQREFSMGNVASEFDHSWRKQLMANEPDNRQKCRSCWARYLCGGGCIYTAYARTGEIFRPDPVRCEVIRHVLQLILFIYSELHEQDKAILGELSDEERWSPMKSTVT